MTKISFIYFDIGGVFFNWDQVFTTPAREFRVTQEQIFDVFEKYDEQITKGDISSQEFWDLVCQDLGISGGEDYDFLPHWISDYKPIKETSQLARSLVQKKYRIGIISNIYEGMFPKLVANGTIPDIAFDPLVLSCDVGMMKPDQDIYNYAQDKSGVSPQETLYIDDSNKHLALPQQMGWQTIHFDTHNPDQSIRQIHQLLA
jgi:putative hydrolase of the HAD superfamily